MLKVLVQVGKIFCQYGNVSVDFMYILMQRISNARFYIIKSHPKLNVLYFWRIIAYGVQVKNLAAS